MDFHPLFDTGASSAAQSGDPAETLVSHRLRRETRADHEAIEANPCLKRLLEPDLTLSEYRLLMLRLGGFYAPVERGLQAWATAFPAALDLTARLVKLNLLRRDLAALGIDQAKIAALPQADFGSFATIEAAWGCLYVIEGSTMGGQIIARTLCAGLGLSAGQGAGFHFPYGTRTGALWKLFKVCLDAQMDRHGFDTDAVVTGAHAAFAALDLWMAGCCRVSG